MKSAEIGIGPNSDRLWFLAEIICTGWLHEINESMDQRSPGWSAASADRLAAQTQEGFRFLIGLAKDLPASTTLLEECRALADRDRRFNFISGLPDSCGFGLRIARTLEHVLGLRENTGVGEVAALLHLFMTLLDGLIDHAPEALQPSPVEFCRALETRLKHLRPPADSISGLCHPLAHITREICGLWESKVRQLVQKPSHRPGLHDFHEAVTTSLRVELATSMVTFDHAPSDQGFDEGCLWGRTRYPHWAQALVPLLGSACPAHFSLAKYRRFIFAVGDYAAWLDDVRDILEDIQSGHWNTVTVYLYHSRPFDCSSPTMVKNKLLGRLGENDVGGRITERVFQHLAEIRKAAKACGLRVAELEPLLADLTFVYLKP